jgi:hypothetical protein
MTVSAERDPLESEGAEQTPTAPLPGGGFLAVPRNPERTAATVRMER